MMNKIKNILYLMRLNKPVGIYLLWFPTAWALSLAYPNDPPALITLWFALGTIIMRSAGCIINDIADRKWDIHVERTKDRPLARQSISLKEAILTLLVLLVLALWILTQLPQNCIYGAIPAILLTMIYPYCKRFFATPQLILSLAFASSIPMVLLASGSTWTMTWSFLLAITLLWVFAYDTQYALADIKDDKKIGIYSSAIFLQSYVNIAIYTLQFLLHSLWLVLAYQLHLSPVFYIGWGLAWSFWIYQYLLLQNEKPLQAFKNNTWYGLWMWLSLLLGQA
jgi:4-hydroxybenzoate polyprenyltransferase